MIPDTVEGVLEMLWKFLGVQVATLVFSRILWRWGDRPPSWLRKLLDQ